jgi:ATP-binding cassette, subfamily B, bacterial PglK
MWRLLNPRERRLFVMLVFISVLATVAELLSVFSILPFLALAGDPSLVHSNATLSAIYNFFGFQTERWFVTAAGICTIAAIMLTNVINVSSLWFRSWYCNLVLAEMSDRLFRGFLSRPYPFFLERNTAVLGKELLSETQNFFTYALEPITVVIARGLQVFAVAIALVVFDWRTATLAAALFGGFYGATYALLHRRIARYGSMRYDANERRFRLAAEALAGVKEVRLFGRERWYIGAFDAESHAMAKATNRLSLYGMTPRFIIEVLVFSALVLSVLVHMARGESFQELAPSLGVFAVAGLRVLPAVQLMFQNTALLAASRLVISRMTSLFGDVNALDAAPPLPQVACEPMRLTRGIEVRDVVFRYRPGATAVLHGVSIDISAGACVGVCGPSGSGKTTLMDICLGLLEPERGSVTIDGACLTAENAPHWQRNIGYVPQSIYLIDGTIAENIAFSTDQRSIDMAAVQRAAQLAHLHDFIVGTEGGYETLVGERGVRLSGGQRQRVAIARALYRDPDVLFFDEATSALDSESEAQVVEAIQSLAHLKTIIIVAHRLSTLRYCDVIHEVKHGRLVRSCTYDELVRSAAPTG